MKGTPPIHPADSSRDRSSGLAVFGAIEILIGLGCAALIPLTLVASVVSPLLDLHAVLPSLALFAVIAAVFVTLGVGSIRARRWATRLTLSLSWVWLITGVGTTALTVWLLPGLLLAGGAGSALDDGLVSVIALLIALFLGVVYVVLPGAFVLFYRSPDVIATCRARDPQPDWTDRCPQRLLALAVAWALGGLSIIAVPAYGFVFPFFGRILSGAAGALGWLIVLVLSGALAWGTCRRAPWAWRTAMAACLIGGISSTLTFAVIDPAELFEVGGLLSEQRALLEAVWPASPVIHVAVQTLIWGSLIAYLFVVKPLFNPPVGAGGSEE
jgi:hypothetical protein